jgi:hypothetical protein
VALPRDSSTSPEDATLVATPQAQRARLREEAPALAGNETGDLVVPTNRRALPFRRAGGRRGFDPAHSPWVLSLRLSYLGGAPAARTLACAGPAAATPLVTGHRAAARLLEILVAVAALALAALVSLGLLLASPG